MITLSSAKSRLSSRTDFERARKCATDLLEEHGYVEPPVDPVSIAREMGLKVYFAEFSDVGKDISGFYDASSNSIFVNSNEYPPRQTFTVAHELGHHLLHAEWAKSSDYRVLLRNASDTDSNPMEIEANIFAANLLVPRKMLDRYVEFASTSELANLFMVSMPVIRNRIKSEYGAQR